MESLSLWDGKEMEIPIHACDTNATTATAITED